MSSTTDPLRPAIAYAVSALALALAVALSVPDTSDGGPLFTMFTPLIAVVIVNLLFGGRSFRWADLGLGRSGLRSWPVAVGVPTLVVTGSYMIASALGLAEIGRPTSDDVTRILTGLALALVLGLSEEIGWRGYLLPLVAPRHEQRGAALVGLLHGAWHLPLMLFTTSYNPLGSRLVTIPVLLAIFTGAGVFYGHLRFASASIWPVVLAHQTFNTVSELFERLATTDRPTALAYAVGETGAITLSLVAVTAAVVVRRSAIVPAGHGSQVRVG